MKRKKKTNKTILNAVDRPQFKWYLSLKRILFDLKV